MPAAATGSVATIANATNVALMRTLDIRDLEGNGLDAL
jgi:hypothetical protein